jgi:hypothetical protein
MTPHNKKEAATPLLLPGDVTDRNNGNDDQGVFCSLAGGTMCPPR